MLTEIKRVDWDANLETGVEIVDEQHRRYFELLNSYLEEASRAAADGNQFFDLIEKFDFLQQYATEHFSTEEHIMQESGFPGFESHRDEHRYFVKHVKALYEKLKSGGFSQDLSREVNYYIIEWFVEHIRRADMELTQYLHDDTRRDRRIARLLKRIYATLFRQD